MADDNNVTDNMTIWDESGNNAVTTTTDGSKERLDVDASISGINRVASPIHENDGYNNNRTKISYTVPTGKVLYIQRLWGAYKSDAWGHIVAFKVDSTQFFWISFNNDGTETFEKTYSENNPYTLTAGEVLTAYRISGSSPEDWSAGFDGYLEDA